MSRKIAILLPYKEKYTNKNAGAASIWVKDYLKISKLNNDTIVYGNLSSKEKPITNNFKNISINQIYIKKNLYYTKKFCESCIVNKHKIIEIHNRPESLNYFFDRKKENGFKLIFVFHNNPLELRGSKSVDERLNIIKNTDYIFFVSEWVKKKFFEKIDIKLRNNCEVLYPSIEPIKKINSNKKKNIIFTGKLNSSKGYDIFLNAITKILNKYHDWTATAVGNEPREKFNISHKRLQVSNWKMHNEILKLYNEASISIVPSRWQEPFGRTAMESAAYGCATITSNNGGLVETFNNELVLKKNSSEELFKEVDKLIKNKKLLKNIQNKNFSNVLHKLNYQVSKLDKIKKFLLFDTLNFFRSKNKKILHISTFDERNNHRLFNISLSNKISKGFIHNEHDVINFSYRNHLGLINKKNAKNSNYKIKEIYDNYRPDLVILGHNNILNKEVLEHIKKNKNSKVILWYEDALSKKAQGPSWQSNMNLIESNSEYIDRYFVTTHPNDIISSKIKKSKLNFLPMLVDENIENLQLFNIKNKFKDLFFAISHGVNFGKLKKNKSDEREKFINKLFKVSNNINFNILGMANENPKWNYDFYKELSKCKMALNLSRGKPIKYATSNRIASLVANGIYTFIDRKTKYDDFVDDNEMGFYKDEIDLVNKIENLKSKEDKIYKYAKNGMKKYFSLFNNKLITKYIINRTFNNAEDKIQMWEKY